MSKKSDKCCKKYLDQKRCKKCPKRKTKVSSRAEVSAIGLLSPGFPS